MKLKNTNKNTNKKWFVITLFFALLQISQTSVALSASITAEEIISLTNKSRTEAGLHLLSVNGKLTEAAGKKVSDMFEFQYFDHNSPSGKTPWDFIKSAGYDYKFAGENLAIDFISATSAHKALMGSSSHRDNILNSNYTEIGIAVKEDIFEGNISIIIVEEFGAPLSKTTSVDYNLNSATEIILENKVNEINDLKDDGKKEISQTGSTQEYGANEEISQTGSTQEHEVNEEISQTGSTQEYGANEGQEEIIDKQYDGLKNISVNEQNESFASDNALIYLKSNLDKIKLSLVNFDENNSRNRLVIENEEINEKTDTTYNSILLTESLNNEKVKGLVNRAYAKEEYLKKYDYEQKSVELAINRYSQNEFITRIFLFCIIFAILLIFDFIFLVCFYRKRESFRIC